MMSFVTSFDTKMFVCFGIEIEKKITKMTEKMEMTKKFGIPKMRGKEFDRFKNKKNQLKIPSRNYSKWESFLHETSKEYRDLFEIKRL